MNAIELRSVSKRYDSAEPLVEEFDLSIAAGESVILVGRSGTGKTTLLNLIALLEQVDAGVLLINGHPVTIVDVGRPRLAYIFQRDALSPWLTVLENMLLGIEARRRPRADDRERARAMLASLGLKGYEQRYPSSLSGGQRQLVAIIQNLLLDPDIFILDEPFSNVDLPTRMFLEAEVIRLVDEARQGRERPMTLLMVTHELEEAIVMGSRIIVLGRHPGAPLRITREIVVDLPASKRDPVAMRASALLRHHFAEITEAMGMRMPTSQGERTLRASDEC